VILNLTQELGFSRFLSWEDLRKLRDEVRGICVCHSGEPTLVSFPASVGYSFLRE